MAIIDWTYIVKERGCISLLLNELLRMISSSLWRKTFLSSSTVRESRETPLPLHNMADLLDDLFQSVHVIHLQAAALADDSVQDGTGHHSLIEQPQLRPSDVEGDGFGTFL